MSLVRINQYNGGNPELQISNPFRSKFLGLAGIACGFFCNRHITTGPFSFFLNRVLVRISFRSLAFLNFYNHGEKEKAMLVATAYFLHYFPKGRIIAMVMDFYLFTMGFWEDKKNMESLKNFYNDGMDPEVFQDACKILDIPEDKMNDQEWIAARHAKLQEGWIKMRNGNKVIDITKEWIDAQIEKYETAMKTIISHKKDVSLD